jgi:hypothetical protein
MNESSNLRISGMFTLPEVGKVTLKSNGDEALSDESLKKSNSNEALNHDFS